MDPPILVSMFPNPLKSEYSALMVVQMHQLTRQPSPQENASVNIKTQSANHALQIFNVDHVRFQDFMSGQSSQPLLYHTL